MALTWTINTESKHDFTTKQNWMITRRKQHIPKTEVYVLWLLCCLLFCVLCVVVLFVPRKQSQHNKQNMQQFKSADINTKSTQHTNTHTIHTKSKQNHQTTHTHPKKHSVEKQTRPTAPNSKTNTINNNNSNSQKQKQQTHQTQANTINIRRNRTKQGQSLKERHRTPKNAPNGIVCVSFLKSKTKIRKHRQQQVKAARTIFKNKKHNTQ